MPMSTAMPMAAIMAVAAVMSMAMQKAEELIVHVVCGGSSRGKRSVPNQT